MDHENFNPNNCIESCRKITILVFSFFFSWLLSFPFEGKILHMLARQYQLPTDAYISLILIAHLIGMLGCGFVVKNMTQAKRLMIFSIGHCLAASFVFSFLPVLFGCLL